jgi:hypothetical protein
MLGKINYGRFGFVCCQFFCEKPLVVVESLHGVSKSKTLFVEDVIFFILAKAMENTTLCLFWMVLLHGDHFI